MSKDFQALSLAEKNRCYFKSIKIKLASSYNSITAIFCEKNTDLDSVFDEAAQHYDAPSRDPVFKIIGVNRDELIEKLTSSMIGEHYTVSENPMQGAVFPQIAFDAKNKGEDFAESALKLMNQLIN